MATNHLQHFFFSLLFVLFMIPTISGDTNSSHSGRGSCIQAEKQALLKLKAGLVDRHNQLSSWGSKEEDCCKWDRVRCNPKSGNVQVLNLRPAVEIDPVTTNVYGSTSYQSTTSLPDELIAFRGEINSSLLELQHLKHLDMSAFGGTFSFNPNLLGSLKELRYLNLSWCDLGGTIPSKIGNLSSLVYLDISHNNFTNVRSLAWLSQLSGLKYLDMTNVNLEHATDWLQAITALPSLLSLSMPECKLKMAPTFPSLSHVNYSKSLEVIRLTSNDLTSSIFPWISNFNNSLVQLWIEDNNLLGPIPEAFGGMPFLETLAFDSNQLEGEIPTSLGRLYRLKKLLMPYNNLTGGVESVQNLTAVQVISLSYNRLTGSLPQSIGQLSNLEILTLFTNSMSGVISHVHFANLTKLRYLTISRNSFTMNLSSEWIPPFQLEVLGMGSCKLGPRFPNWLRTQHSLAVLEIPNNGISDVIGDWFWELPVKLIYFVLSGNHISGEIQKLSSILSDFSTVDLSSNNFYGPFPLLPPNVTQLNLSKNMLSGNVSNLCSMTGGELTYLDLSSNFLSGELPDCWNHWKKLFVLSLANNNFSGRIPPSLGSLRAFQTLHLRNNSFTGELPPSLGNCHQLELLDVGENKLSGQIPDWIGTNLSSLIILRLRSNHFYGTMPLAICHLNYIQILDISNNNISGSIPDCLMNFTAMARQGGAIETFVRNVSYPFGSGMFIMLPYVDNIEVVWKGMEMEYGKTLGLVKSLDLSRNNFRGEIPAGVTSLLGLVALNFSYNQLTGSIPGGINQLEWLQSLDLSVNHLSGVLPQGLSELSFLSYLDLSYNNLSGKIPRSTQLQSLDPTSFRGNPELCGEPLPACPGDDAGQNPSTVQSNSNPGQQNEEEELLGRGFFVSMGIGFGAGFWGVCGTLVLNRSWRHAYFLFLDHMQDQLCVAVMLSLAKLKTRLCLRGM